MVDSNPTLAEAAAEFLPGLAASGRGESQQEVNRFVRWFGRDRLFSSMTAPEVAKYAEQLSSSDTDYARKLEFLRAFLVFAKKKGWTGTGLSGHLKAKKGKTAAAGGRQLQQVDLTRQGYEELRAEIDGLKEKRLEVIEEIRSAAADKDFRENAPLDAAREQKGHIEGRIMELEEMLKAATVIGEEVRSNVRIAIGAQVLLHDLASGDEYSYRIVHPREVDPLQGKISLASPLGKALMGKGEGEEVEMTVPAGKMRYKIQRIEG